MLLRASQLVINDELFDRFKISRKSIFFTQIG
jgi:hypothetical protein